jgi:hypothetical protein
MANTLIQLKSSTSNATPTTLDAAEPAYSYVSNTLFIGTASGTGVLPIGGQFYVAQQGQIFDKTNAAFTAANSGSGAASAGSYANAGYSTANSAASYANAAFAAANNSTDLWVRTQANSAFSQANAAFLQANTPSYVSNSAASYANAAFAAANVATATDTTQNASITAAFIQANAAFEAANNAGGSVQGNTITLGANTVGLLVSNAVTLTTETTVTNGLSLINNVLGKLVPPGPPAFPSSNTITIASVASYRMTNFTQTDRTSNSRGVAAGTTVTNARRAATYSITPTIPDQGPGDSGTLTLFVNGANTVARTLTSTSANGTYTSGGHSLVISDSVDYGSKIVGTAQGFWRSFDCSANGTTSNGWNELFITHSGASSTNTPFWYYDDSAPGTPTFATPTIVPSSTTVIYSSTVPHYTSATTFLLGVNVSKLSGDMYPTSNNFFTGTAGGAFGAPTSNNYPAVGITVMARNYLVASGSLVVNSTSTIISGFGSSATGPSVTVDNSYSTASQAFTTALANTVLYKTGTASLMEETTVTFGSTVGTGSGLAARIINPGTTDNPSYTAGASLFNSQSSTLTANDATIVAATLKHDQINYSTGYLPAGPNLSTGRTGAQYFTFRFVRTSLSKFNIKFTGTIAGMFVALPGSAIDAAASATNGWLSMATAYGGAGVPSSGCALGGVVTLNSAVSAHSKTCTFGTVSSSDTATNEIYVRIKLTSGQSVSALSLETASN